MGPSYSGGGLAAPIPVQVVRDIEFQAVLTARDYLQIVHDPGILRKRAFAQVSEENARYVELYELVQRSFSGRKAENARDYSRYIERGLEGEEFFVLPENWLWSPDPLHVDVDEQLAYLKFGQKLVVIDGQTQTGAAFMVAERRPDLIDRLKVKTVFLHGISLDKARQAFFDKNVKEVKPSPNFAAPFDTRDPINAIVKELIGRLGPERFPVKQTGRQLGTKDREVLTYSAVRALVATTLGGRSWIKTPNRAYQPPEGVTVADAERDALRVVEPVVEFLLPYLKPSRREEIALANSTFMAGVGTLCHRAMPIKYMAGEDRPPISVDDVIETVKAIDWKRDRWEGIGTVRSEKSGKLGPMAPGHAGAAVAEAINERDSEPGRKVRYQKPAA
jgi:hypothetical protein